MLSDSFFPFQWGNQKLMRTKSAGRRSISWKMITLRATFSFWTISKRTSSKFGHRLIRGLASMSSLRSAVSHLQRDTIRTERSRHRSLSLGNRHPNSICILKSSKIFQRDWKHEKCNLVYANIQRCPNRLRCWLRAEELQTIGLAPHRSCRREFRLRNLAITCIRICWSQDHASFDEHRRPI